MNGRVDYLVTEEEINLTRGPSGTCGLKKGRGWEDCLEGVIASRRSF
jgi:hypothetical protein